MRSENNIQGTSQRDPNEYEDALQKQQTIQDGTTAVNPQQNITTINNILDLFR